MELWARIAARRLRRASPSLLVGGEMQRYGPLREAIADYLGTSRGVDCTSDEIVILSGGQQGLDLLARFLVKGGDSVWIEDPAYPAPPPPSAMREHGSRPCPSMATDSTPPKPFEPVPNYGQCT